MRVIAISHHTRAVWMPPEHHQPWKGDRMPTPVEVPETHANALAALSLLASACVENDLEVFKDNASGILIINHRLRRPEFAARVCVVTSPDELQWFYWQEYSLPLAQCSAIAEALAAIKRQLSVVLR